MAAVLWVVFRVSEEPKVPAVIGQAVAELSNTKELGKVLYSQYVYPWKLPP